MTLQNALRSKLVGQVFTAYGVSSAGDTDLDGRPTQTRQDNDEGDTQSIGSVAWTSGAPVEGGGWGSLKRVAQTAGVADSNEGGSETVVSVEEDEEAVVKAVVSEAEESSDEASADEAPARTGKRTAKERQEGQAQVKGKGKQEGKQARQGKARQGKQLAPRFHELSYSEVQDRLVALCGEELGKELAAKVYSTTKAASTVTIEKLLADDNSMAMVARGV